MYPYLSHRIRCRCISSLLFNNCRSCLTTVDFTPLFSKLSFNYRTKNFWVGNNSRATNTVDTAYEHWTWVRGTDTATVTLAYLYIVK